MEPKLHPDLEPLAFLLGTWRGKGHGDYPTTEPFTYDEEMVFDHRGDPYLMYSQGAWTPEGEPIHFERGFLRPVGEGRVDLSFAHPIGVTEVSEGTVSGTSLDLRSTAMGRTPTGDAVTGIARRITVEGDVLSYVMDMAMESTPMTFHTAAELRRV